MLTRCLSADEISFGKQKSQLRGKKVTLKKAKRVSAIILLLYYTADNKEYPPSGWVDGSDGLKYLINAFSNL